MRVIAFFSLFILILLMYFCFKLAYVCLLAFIGLGSCSEIEKVMPSRYEIENSINRTIQEVEKLIQENPSLPKLSRDDIVNILYNITSQDMSSVEDEALKAIKKTREDYQRALMVVLPYKLKDSEESLKELFTKPPMVQMVADEASGSRKDSEIETAQQYDNFIGNKHQSLIAHMRFEGSKKGNTPTTTYEPTEYTTETSTVPTTTDAKPDSEPHKFSFNLATLDQKAEASHTSVGTKRPVYKGTFSRYRTSTPKPAKLEIIYSTTARATTTDLPITETTTLPKKPSHDVLSSDQWRYYAPPSTTTTTTTSTSTTTASPKTEDSPWKPMSPDSGYFVPSIENASGDSDEADFSIIKMEDFQQMMETTTLRPAPIFVTPSAITNPPKKVQSGVKSVPSSFKLMTSTTTTTASPTPMRQEVEQLLKSIGLQPMKSNKQNDFNLQNHNLNAQLNAYFSSKVKDSKFGGIDVDATAIKDSNSFEAPQPPLKDGVKNLSPDIQLLFQRFGLQLPGQQEVAPTTTTSTTFRPVTSAPNSNSYTKFKPLPTSSVRDKDFRNFLARFGLGIGESRNQKAMQPKQITKRPSLIDAVPENMKKILENIGLIKTAPTGEPQFPEIRTQAPKYVERTTTPATEHIFKPHEISTDDKEQNEKIKALLNAVKMVQEGKADVQAVQRAAHELLMSTKSLASGPDPLKLEEILNNYRDNLKNEVKRQQEKTTTTEATATTEELDESTLSSMASTDSSGSFSEISATSASSSGDSKSSSSDTMPTKAEGSFFDTFDISEYLNNSSSTTTTTAAPSSDSSTGKPDFFDNLDLNLGESGKNSSVNISDLEASFGGTTPEPDPVLPTRPKTGLYFLVDWNSFLEVGEEGKDKVNLRFAPKVGDRTRFIPVKIP